MNLHSYQNLHEQAKVALNNNEVEKAHAYLVKIINKNPRDANAYFLLSKVNIKVGQIAKAAKLIEKALSFNDTIEYRAELAKCYALMGELTKAKESIKSIPPNEVKKALAADTIGVALSRVGLHQQALLFFKQAITLNNKKAEYQYNHGISCKFVGDVKQAIQSFERAISLDAEHVAAHYALSELSKSDQNNNHIERLLPLYNKIQRPDELLYISHALAREYETNKDYDRAFESLSQAKKVKRAQVNYQLSNDLDTFKILNHQLEQQPFNGKIGCDDDSAIFVVGMPRTGTTVVERMLTQSVDVHSAGELQDFAILTKQLSQDPSNKILNENVLKCASNIDFKKLGETYINKAKAISDCQSRFVDKMPLNVLYSQLILTALPKAKIICLLRNPLDTIISNYRQLFATNFSYYHYSLNLNDIYNFYKAFKLYAQKCAEKFPDNFKIIQYEDLVNNPIDIGKAIFEHCSLAWKEEYALIENNTSPVDTASALQVRKPISNNNIGNWKKYQEALEDIIIQMKHDGVIQ